MLVLKIFKNISDVHRPDQSLDEMDKKPENLFFPLLPSIICQQHLIDMVIGGGETNSSIL